MDFKFDSSWVLYAAGAFSAVLTLGFFGASNAFNLSPVTKSIILVSLSTILVALGLYMKDRVISGVSYFLSAVSYVVFAFYTFSKLWRSPGANIISLGLISTAFIFLGYLVSNEKIEISRRRFLRILGALSLIGAVFVGLDVTGAQPTYELDLKDSVNISDNQDEVEVGKLKVENSFFLHRDFEDKDYDACIYTPKKERSYISQNPGSYDIGILKPGEHVDVSLTANIHLRSDNKSAKGTYKVKQMDECPDSSRKRMIVVVQQENDRFD